MQIPEVQQCDISSWLKDYSHLTFPTNLIPIPCEVITYLNTDSTLILPLECDADGYFDNHRHYSDSEDNTSDFGEELDENDQEEKSRPSFPEFSDSIKSLLSEKGSVFCKLNWSSPKDAIWISHSLKCSTLTDIFLLLKSSMFVNHDITSPFKDCEATSEEVNEAMSEIQYNLALREWRSINPGHEFRCFVKNGSLKAISQRDFTSFYDYIIKEESFIKEDLTRFHKNNLSNFPLNDFVFDVVRSSKGKITLVDFNPSGITTDALLFEWSELQEIEEMEFRFISEEKGIRSDTLRQYSLPTDVVDIANGTDHDKLLSFLELQAEMQKKNT
ncbi:translation initiation factor eIF2 assembly protein [Lepeophtheirus salmonis]|uniref:translation initiation factor eIF2 assembly protein n=1 Tax=Lepeophtheirus salmonis TaxID=72036 RepID=UPI001AEB6DA0|nr:cell division cycle protein 123 homolog [Lepeophtheirus salmonis]